MILLKLLFFIIIWIMLGCLLLYIDLLSLSKKQLNKLIKLNRTTTWFKKLFLIYIPIAPFLLVIGIFVRFFIFFNDLFLGKKYLTKNIEGTLYTVAQLNGYEVPMKKSEEDEEETYDDDVDDDDEVSEKTIEKINRS